MNTYVKKAGSFMVYALAIVGAITVLTVGGIAIAGHKHDKDDKRERAEHFAEHMSEHIADKLDLNDSQEDKLHDMLKGVAEKRHSLRESAKNDIRTMVLQDSMSQEDAMRLLEMRKTRRAEMHEFIAAQMVAFHAGLDDDQKEELAEIAPRWLAKHGRKHGGKHRRGHGHGYDDWD